MAANEKNELKVFSSTNDSASATPPSSMKGAHLEDALAETQFGWYNYIIILASGIAMCDIYLETANIAFVLPVSTCDLNWTIQQKAVLGSVCYFGFIASSHLWGFLADTTGRKYVTVTGLLGAFTCTIFSSFANSFSVLLTFRLLSGIFIAAASSSIYAYLGEFHTIKTRDRALMIASIIYGIGCILLPVFAWIIINKSFSWYIPVIGIQYKSWRLFMVVCGLPGLFIGLVFLILPESPKYLLSVGRHEETLKVLQEMYHMNTHKSKETFPINHILKDLDTEEAPRSLYNEKEGIKSIPISIWNQTVPIFERKYIRVTLILCVVQFMVYTTSNGMYVWFPEIVNEVKTYLNNNPNTHLSICTIYDMPNNDTTNNTCKQTLDISTYTYTFILRFFALGSFMLLWLIINKVPKKMLMCSILCICGTSGILTSLLKEPMIAVYFFIISVSTNINLKVVSAAIVDYYPTKLRGMAFSIITNIVGHLGAVVASNYIGALLQHHCGLAFYTTGGIAILTGFSALLLPKPPMT